MYISWLLLNLAGFEISDRKLKALGAELPSSLSSAISHQVLEVAASQLRQGRGGGRMRSPFACPTGNPRQDAQAAMWRVCVLLSDLGLVNWESPKPIQVTYSFQKGKVAVGGSECSHL